MARGKRRRRTRIAFDIFERIRDHHDCDQYEECLDHASTRNNPRVCHEECRLYVPPDPREAFIIAEILDHLREALDQVQGEIDADLEQTKRVRCKP
ncbi:MAG: hypothetical protein WC565_04010 [Parcubacteria group bacterium]